MFISLFPKFIECYILPDPIFIGRDNGRSLCWSLLHNRIFFRSISGFSESVFNWGNFYCSTLMKSVLQLVTQPRNVLTLQAKPSTKSVSLYLSCLHHTHTDRGKGDEKLSALNLSCNLSLQHAQND